MKLPIEMRNSSACFFLLFITAASYWPVHSYEFVNYDDQGYVYENKHVLQGLNPNTIRYAFSSTDLANYHPLTWISYELDVSLFGPHPEPFHLENVFIHAVNAALLFLFLLRATGGFGPAFFSAAIFAVHPVHVESVAWISERKDVLGGFFFFLALLMYLNYVRSAPGAFKYVAYLATLLLMLLSLLVKQTIVTFPFILLLLDYWPLKRLARKHVFIEKIPFLVVSIAASVTAFVIQRAGGAVVTTSDLPFADRVANAGLSYIRYLGKFLWPRDLSIFYPRIKYLPISAVLLSFAVIALITLASFLDRRRRPFLIFGWLFFLGTLVPMIGLVQAGWQSIADRYLYLPMIGLIVIVAWAGAGFVRNRWLATSISTTLVLLASAVTINQLQYWHDTRKLFEHALEVNPENTVAHVQLGYLDAQLGRVDDARRHYEQAIRIDPTYYVTEFDLANLLLNNHQPQLALIHFERADADRPGLAKIQNNWGVTLLQLNRPREAFEHFKAAAEVDPTSADAHFNLGQLFLDAMQWNSAAAEFQTTLQLDPNRAGALQGLHAALAGALKNQHDAYDRSR